MLLLSLAMLLSFVMMSAKLKLASGLAVFIFYPDLCDDQLGELTCPARGTYPSTVVSEPLCPAQISLYSEDARPPSSSIPYDPGWWQTPALHLSAMMVAWVSRLCSVHRINIIAIHGLYLCSHGDKPTFARLLLWAVTNLVILVHGEHWPCNYIALIV